MKSWLSRAAVLAVAATAVLSGPAAHAQTVTLDDAQGDVFAIKRHATPLGDTHPNADIVSATVSHAPQVVRVTVKLADLARNDEFRTVSAGLRTPGRTLFVVQWSAYAQRPRGDVFVLSSDPRQDRCHGARAIPDYDADVVRLEVPRSCLGRPEWVRALVQAGAGGFGESDEYLGDIAGNRRWSAYRAWTARLTRG